MSESFRRFIKKQWYTNTPFSQNIKYKTTFNGCVRKALQYRQWEQTYDDDWNIMWCKNQQVSWIFQKYQILPNIKINHFPGWQELCHPDKLNNNIKKYKKKYQKQNNNESNQYNFLPATYLLPNQYLIFYEQFKRHANQSALWIMKPTASNSQGKGSFLFSKISQIDKWKTFNINDPPQPHICQRYIANPLLFGGKKLLLRIYALCTSYQPLTIYLYRDGIGRFERQHENEYNDNLYIHLTGMSINKHSPNRIKKRQCFLLSIKKYMLSKMGIEKTNKSFTDMETCIINSLKAVKKLVTNRPQSFQLYGFDFIFDNNGKPWLLKVDGEPSMSAKNKKQQTFKVGLIDDTLTIINIQGILKGDEENIGGFDLIYKNKQISLYSSVYTTMLGSKCNRLSNLYKFSKLTACRLHRQYQQKHKNKQIISPKVQKKFIIKTPIKSQRIKTVESSISYKNMQQHKKKNIKQQQKGPQITSNQKNNRQQQNNVEQ